MAPSKTSIRCANCSFNSSVRFMPILASDSRGCLSLCRSPNNSLTQGRSDSHTSPGQKKKTSLNERCLLSLCNIPHLSDAQPAGWDICRNWHLLNHQWLPRLLRAGPSTSLDVAPARKYSHARLVKFIIGRPFCRIRPVSGNDTVIYMERTFWPVGRALSFHNVANRLVKWYYLLPLVGTRSAMRKDRHDLYNPR